MKNLLLIFLLALPIASLHAQDLTDDGKDISIKLHGGKIWDETEFDIDIEKRDQSVFIRYYTRGKYDLPGINGDTIYRALVIKHKNAPFKSKEKQILNDRLLSIMNQHRLTYQDSLKLNAERYRMYKLLLKYVAKSDDKTFDGAYPSGMMDGDFLFCKITYNGRTRKVSKDEPLSVTSPLLYTFLKETLKIGREAQCKSVLVIDKDFEYMF